MRTEIAAESVKAAPPVTVAALTMGGWSLNDMVLIATLVYIVLQAGYLLWRWWRDYQNAKES